MTDCLAYALVPHGAKQMEIAQAEARLGRNVCTRYFMFVKRNNWMGYFFLTFGFSTGEKKKSSLIYFCLFY